MNENRILTHVAHRDTVLIAAHGNSFRAMIMRLENLSPQDVPGLELATGVPLIYEVDEQAQVINKHILAEKL